LRRRSSKPGRQRAETRNNAPTLASNDQNVPWVSGSQPSRPNSCRGRSQPMSNGPCSIQPRPNQPASVNAGSSSVYIHMPKPSSRPASTPCRLAPRQYRPPISAGANCATAANDINPYEASVVSLPLTR
jgi:hypothetical protein